MCFELCFFPFYGFENTYDLKSESIKAHYACVKQLQTGFNIGAIYSFDSQNWLNQVIGLLIN